MLACRSCGVAVPASEASCPACGARVDISDSPTGTRPPALAAPTPSPERSPSPGGAARRPGERFVRLAEVDRHEVAHCVINRLFTPWSEPPALLLEGWAQANSGSDATQLAEDAWSSRAVGDWLSLRELTGPDWVGRHFGPVYGQGAPLVNYLLDKFGPEAFLELYTTCDRGAFALFTATSALSVIYSLALLPWGLALAMAGLAGAASLAALSPSLSSSTMSCWRQATDR